MKLVVYCDDEYPTWWISREVSRKIVNFLKNKGFVELNAEDLAKWMEKSINENKCHESVVVFSQDIAPNTLCRWRSPSSLFRAYLDCGGRVVWIGDTPFYYIGMHSSYSNKVNEWSEKKKEESLRFDPDGKIAELWSRDGPFNILGVMPVYMDFPASKVTITSDGKLLGLQNPWYGLRPIILKAKDLRKKNLRILGGASKPLTPVPYKKIWFKKDIKEERMFRFPSLMEIISKVIGLVPTIIAISTALFTLLAGYSLQVTLFFVGVATFFLSGYVVHWFLHARETLVSGWWKNYNANYPTSGFVRIWDCHLDRITETMLQELNNVALARI